jgi:RNA polymerase sigma factor (sigma-70 family)
VGSKPQVEEDDSSTTRSKAGRGPDEDLLIEIGHGDKAALEQLYRRQGPSLLSLLTRMFDDHQMVEEVIQDTFLAVWNGAQFDGRSRVRTWLVGIAIRQAGSRRRRRRFPLGIQTGDVVSDEPSPEDTVVTSLEAHRAVNELAQLTQVQREVLLLAFAEELTHPEIAEVLGIRLGTVKSRMHGARRALERRWQQGGMK